MTALPSARPSVTPVPTTLLSVASFGELAAAIQAERAVVHVDGHIVFASVLDIARTLSLVSEGGAMLDGDLATQLFYVHGSLELRGLTLIRGSAYVCVEDRHTMCTPANSMGGAIRVYESGILSLIACVVRDHRGLVGGAIWNNGQLTAINTVFCNNTGSEGAAVTVLSKRRATIVGCSFGANYADDEAGALYAGTQAAITITNSEFIRNTAPGTALALLGALGDKAG